MFEIEALSLLGQSLVRSIIAIESPSFSIIRTDHLTFNLKLNLNFDNDAKKNLTHSVLDYIDLLEDKMPNGEREVKNRLSDVQSKLQIYENEETEVPREDNQLESDIKNLNNDLDAFIRRQSQAPRSDRIQLTHGRHLYIDHITMPSVPCQIANSNSGSVNRQQDKIGIYPISINSQIKIPLDIGIELSGKIEAEDQLKIEHKPSPNVIREAHIPLLNTRSNTRIGDNIYISYFPFSQIGSSKYWANYSEVLKLPILYSSTKFSKAGHFVFSRNIGGNRLALGECIILVNTGGLHE